MSTTQLARLLQGAATGIIHTRITPPRGASLWSLRRHLPESVLCGEYVVVALRWPCPHGYCEIRQVEGHTESCVVWPTQRSLPKPHLRRCNLDLQEESGLEQERVLRTQQWHTHEQCSLQLQQKWGWFPRAATTWANHTTEVDCPAVLKVRSSNSRPVGGPVPSKASGKSPSLPLSGFWWLPRCPRLVAASFCFFLIFFLFLCIFSS